MKIPCSLLVIAVSLNCLGCKKESTTPQFEALFNQQFTLGYPQSAYLPTQSSPELTVSLDDILDTRCPPNAQCLLAGNVQATVGVRGQNDPKQVATLCLGCGPATGANRFGRSTGQQPTVCPANAFRNPDHCVS
jgi:hypothetical protein